MSLFQVQEKLKKGEVIEGVLRINPKNYEDAYISAPDEGMDIYIGGVRDRNAALHGDVVMVEIKPKDQWKVLYDQLDEYLDNNIEAKNIVYSASHSNASASSSNIPNMSAASPNISTSSPNMSAASITTSTTKTKHRKTRNTGRTRSSDVIALDDKPTSDALLDQADSDVVIEEDSEESGHEKKTNEDLKKKKRRRGKRRRHLRSDSNSQGQGARSSSDKEDMDNVSSVNMKVADELRLLTGSRKNMAAIRKLKDENRDSQTSSEDEGDINDGVAVTPDELSESDSTDGESCESDIIDYEQVQEDDEFIKAQLEAVQRDEALPKGKDILDVSVKSPQACTDIHKVKVEKEIESSKGEISIPNSLNADAKGINTRDCKEDMKKLTEDVERKMTSLGFDEFKNEDKNIKADRDNREKDCKKKENKVSVSDRLSSSFSENEPNAVNIHPLTGQPIIMQKSIAQNQAQKKSYNIRQNSGKLDRTEPSIFQIQNISNWTKFVQRTATVVLIREFKHNRMGAGMLKLFGDGNPNCALFSPSDYRLPRMKIPMRMCPPDFFHRSQDYSKRIFLGKIVQWKEPKFALGEIVRDVGAIGDVEAETEALLLENGIDYSEFPDIITENLPTIPWTIPQEEIACRTDLRDSCIFTIDPATARDLDDAMSCLPLPNGNFRVGVHIADVSYFVAEGIPLDNLASERATSVYLTQKVIPMLPRVLCEHLCSLNPGEDRLAFSVIWELDPNGQIIGEWFGRTVIRSCTKLSYQHAQGMIENPEKIWSPEELPEISGGYNSRQISQIVNNLQSIAKRRRDKRFKDGALRLDQVKLAFNLDHETKMPNGFFVYELKDSNRLIEEFMLLANMAVAHKIYASFPQFAVLRRHPPPLSGPMETCVSTLQTLGIHLDHTSAGTLQTSLERYVGNDQFSSARLQLITSMCSKPMQFARYFCTGILEHEKMFSHYALNVPLYTHFTSPIRRYADVLVHRLLAAAVDPARYDVPARSKEDLQRIADHCNDKKQTAKTCSDVSGELYLALFVRQVKEMVEEGMVIGVLNRSVDVMVLRLGVIKRVYTDKLPLSDVVFDKDNNSVPYLNLKWESEKNASDSPPVQQKLTYFSKVTVALRPADGNNLKFNAILLRPN